MSELMNILSEKDKTDLFSIMKTDAKAVDNILKKRYESQAFNHFERLMEAEQYSLFSGGKRIRPFLAIETCKMFGGNLDAVLHYAAAVEMVHSYSLIHDDLPCMDNDVLRRGKPTNHVVYGEATALLAGDGLLTDAFDEIASAPDSSENIVVAVRVLSHSAGSLGMVGGQYMDLNMASSADLSELLSMQALKTGAMFGASVQMGLCASEITENSGKWIAMQTYAQNVGLAFQIADDILDANAEQNNKKQDENSFLSYYSISDAQQYVNELTTRAVRVLEPYPNADVLKNLAIWLASRPY